MGTKQKAHVTRRIRLSQASLQLLLESHCKLLIAAGLIPRPLLDTEIHILHHGLRGKTNCLTAEKLPG